MQIAAKPPYSCMGGLHSIVDGALQLRQRAGFSAAGITKIRIGIGQAMFHHAGWRLERPATVIGAQMNAAYAAAVALLDGAAFVPQFAPLRLGAEDVWELIAKTAVSHDRDIDDAGEGARWASRLRITLADGRVEEVENRHPWGGIARPMTNADVVDKYHRMMGLVTDAGHAEALKAFVLEIEQRPDVGELARLMGLEVRSPMPG